MTTAPALFIIDDDPDIRRLCAQVVSGHEFQVHLFESAEQFLATVEPSRQGCLLTDVRMSGMSGLELIEKLRRDGSPMVMLAMSGFADVPMAVAALKAGAADFLQKPLHPADLLDKVRRALGQTLQPTGLKHGRGEILGRLAALSNREREVFHLIVQGKANKVVAAELGLSEKTVEIHRSNVMRKMAADSFAHLVRMAVAVEDRTTAAQAA